MTWLFLMFEFTRSHKVRLCTVSTKETLELVIEIDDKGLSIMSTIVTYELFICSPHIIIFEIDPEVGVN
jgi:hypothetical protein